MHVVGQYCSNILNNIVDYNMNNVMYLLETHVSQTRTNYFTGAFFCLASYNWSSTGSKNHPSEYLVDLLTYLRVTFLTFTNLPVSMVGVIIRTK